MIKLCVGMLSLVLGVAMAVAQTPPLKLVVLQPLDRPNIVAERGVLDVAFKHAGLSYTLDFNPAERALAAFKEGVFDGDINRVGSFNQSYPQAIRVEPHIQGGFFFAIGSSQAAKPSSWGDLNRHSVAYVRGYRAIEIRTAGVVRREVTDSEDACLRMAAAQRVDWCVLGSDRMSEWPLQAQYGDRLHGTLFDSVKVYLWLGPQHQDAARRLSRALRDMEQSGELQKAMAPYRQVN